MNIEIIPAKIDQLRVEDFCKFQQTHGNREYDKGFLPTKVWQQFLEQAPESLAEFWLAYYEDKPVGRIGASLMPSYQGLGSIGFFECDLTLSSYREIIFALLQKAIDWLKARSCYKAVGPMNMNTWFPYRFRSDEDIVKRYIWEPVHPPEYLEEWISFGFSVNARYKAFNTDQLAGFIRKTKPSYNSCIEKGFHFRDFDQDCFLERDVPILYEMSMECFKDNYLFEPISLDSFRSLYVPIADKIDHSLGQLCFAKDGSPAGFGFSFIDGDSFVLKTLATMPQQRGHGISNALAYLAGTTAYDRGFNNYITAIIHAGAQSESYGKKGNIIWEHNYDLLEISI
ncbi:MAG: GNAT family N-acetyltransferase [Oligoflexales bacterium]